MFGFYSVSVTAHIMLRYTRPTPTHKLGDEFTLNDMGTNNQLPSHIISPVFLYLDYRHQSAVIQSTLPWIVKP